MGQVLTTLPCSREGCSRSACWRPVLEVLIARPGEREVLSVVLPLMFCDDHRLSPLAAARLARSPRFRRAIENRLDGGWSVNLDRAWFQRRRIENDWAAD